MYFNAISLDSTAKLHRADLLREAEQERLADQARGHADGVSVSTWLRSMWHLLARRYGFTTLAYR